MAPRKHQSRMQMEEKETKTFEAGDMADANVSAGANQSIATFLETPGLENFNAIFEPIAALGAIL